MSFLMTMELKRPAVAKIVGERSLACGPTIETSGRLVLLCREGLRVFVQRYATWSPPHSSREHLTNISLFCSTFVINFFLALRIGIDSRGEQTLNLVVATIMLLLVIKYFILRWGGPERQRQGKAVGFSCVLFAYMTYLAVAMGSYCPFGPGSAELCFKTYFVPMPRGESVVCRERCRRSLDSISRDRSREGDIIRVLPLWWVIFARATGCVFRVSCSSESFFCSVLLCMMCTTHRVHASFHNVLTLPLTKSFTL